MAEVEQSMYRPEQALRCQEVEAPRFQDNRHLKVVRVSSLLTGRLYPQQIFLVLISVRARGGIVAKALRYNPAGRGFDSRWCHWNFSVTSSFRSHYGPGVDSVCNRNEYQVYFLGVKAAGA